MQPHILTRSIWRKYVKRCGRRAVSTYLDTAWSTKQNFFLVDTVICSARARRFQTL